MPPRSSFSRTASSRIRSYRTSRSISSTRERFTSKPAPSWLPEPSSGVSATAARFGEHRLESRMANEQMRQLPLDDLDFEDPRPELAGHEQAIAGGVVGNTIQDRVRRRAFGLREQSGEIDPPGHAAVLRRNPRDAIGLPDIGVDLPLDVLQLVQVLHRPASVVDDDAAGLLERDGVDETQCAFRLAIAHDHARAVVRDPPALALVIEGLPLLERGDVVDEADLRLPCDLDQRAVPVGDALAEILRAERLALNDLARFQLDLPDARAPVEAGAFVEEPVSEDEALRKRFAIVRKRADHLVAVGRHGRLARSHLARLACPLCRDEPDRAHQHQPSEEETHCVSITAPRCIRAPRLVPYPSSL